MLIVDGNGGRWFFLNKEPPGLRKRSSVRYFGGWRRVVGVRVWIACLVGRRMTVLCCAMLCCAECDLEHYTRRVGEVTGAGRLQEQKRQPGPDRMSDCQVRLSDCLAKKWDWAG